MSGLQVTGLARHFGGVKAVDGVSFSVAPGECVALIGPNGAGKSTCFACIAGQLPPSVGSVSWGGHRIDGMSPAQRLRLGVGRSFQVAQVFESLTVLQNIELCSQQILGQSSDLLQKAGLEAHAKARAGDLPYGAKKRLEMAMALASGPKLLLLDEPAAGLSATERAGLMRWVREVAASGVAVLYTEHNMDAVFGVADRVLVLIDGQLAAEGTADEVQANPTVQTRYLGRGQGAEPAAPEWQPRANHALPSAEPLLHIKNLNAYWGEAQALFDVSLAIAPGQCTVLKGLNGAGKSTLLQAICGLGPRIDCTLRYENESIEHWPTHQRAQAGIGWVAEDRRLFTGLSVAQNLEIAARGSEAKKREKLGEVLALFPALKTMLKRPAAQMSGGEQQMLAIARTLMMSPKLLLLDEPCEGIAPVLVDAIVQALAQLKAQGVTMLIAEQHQAIETLADWQATLVSGKLSIAQVQPQA